MSVWDDIISGSYLQKGSSGSAVSNLQSNLTNAGYNVGVSGSDGIYGPDTHAAVSQLQKDNNITVDGIAGPETKNVLNTITSGGTMLGNVSSGIHGTIPPPVNTMTADDIWKAAGLDKAQAAVDASIKAKADAAAAASGSHIGVTDGKVDPVMQALLDLVKGLSTPKTITPYQAPANTLPTWAQNLQPFQAPQVHKLSFDEAMAQAIAALNPQYDTASRQLTNNLNQDQESRGLFFSPLGAKLSADKQADLSNAKQTALQNYSQDLVGKSQDQANTEIAQALAQWQANTGLATNLMGQQETASNDSFNQWLGSQGLNINANTANVDSATKLATTLDSLKQSTSADQKAAVEQALSRANAFGIVTNETDAKILGVPVGTSTVQAKVANSSILNDVTNRDSAAVDAAIKRADVTGTVNNEADAKVLGVPVGTTTQQAKVINSQLDATVFNQNMSKVDAALKRADAFGKVTTAEDAKVLGVPINTSTQSARVAAAQILSAQRGDAVASTNTFGTVTNTADAKLLGVPVGTETFAAKTQAITNAIAQIDEIMKKVDMLGYVDKEASVALHVPIGTTSLAAKQMAQQLAIAKINDATNRAQINKPSSSSSTDNTNHLMDVWKITGYAPSGLENLGVKPGTPYAPVDTTKPDAKAISGIQSQFGTDSNTADDIFSIWQSPTKDSAMAELQAAQQAASGSGKNINTDTIMKAIEYKWPATVVPDNTSTNNNWWDNLMNSVTSGLSGLGVR